MKIRKIIFWMHLVAGVLAGVVILIMSFTGVCLAFESQLVNSAERGMRELAPAASSATRLSYGALLEKARAANPDTAPTGLFVRSEVTASVMVNFGREDVLYLHPYTGEILGHGSKIRGFMQQIENCHRWLGAADAHRPGARAVTGACNFTFLFLAVSGVYLWWPRNWNRNALRPSIWFVGGLRGKARDWNWHNTIGLWCSPVLILLTLTGVVMSYQWANNLVYRLSGNQPPPPQAERFGGNQQREKSSRHADQDDEQPSAASLDALIEKAKQQLPDWSTLTLRLPPRAGMPVTISIQQSGAPSFYRSQLTLNSSTAEIVKWEPFSGQNSGRKLRTWVRFTHTGEAGGVVGQTIAAIASAGGVILVCTGLALACRRFFGKKSAGIDMKTFASTEHDANSISGPGVFTLVLWIGCALVSVFGFMLPYAHPRPPQAQPPAVKVEMLEVKLTADPQPILESSHNSTVADPLAQPQIPQPVAVAQPSPAIAFALPVEGPVQIVAPRYAAHTQAPPAPAPSPTPQKLIFGEGEGAQPEPDYPDRARRQGQEGTVMIRFTVAENGHIAAAEIVESCRWPLLNESALHAVRERWRFLPGPIRIFDVPIRFQLRAK